MGGQQEFPFGQDMLDRMQPVDDVRLAAVMEAARGDKKVSAAVRGLLKPSKAARSKWRGIIPSRPEMVLVLYAGRGNLAEAASIIQESLTQGTFNQLLDSADAWISYEAGVLASPTQRREIVFDFARPTKPAMIKAVAAAKKRGAKVGNPNRMNKPTLEQAYADARAPTELAKRARLRRPKLITGRRTQERNPSAR